MAQLNTAEICVKTLIANGIDKLFCLPGVQNDNFFDALARVGGDIQPFHTRHEQGAAYMAVGAAQASGKPQAFCVVPGPGFLNAGAALSTAYATSSPVLAFIGQIAERALGKDLGMLHEIPDQLGTLQGLTKWASRITGPEEAEAKLRLAFDQMTNRGPRPTGIEVPIDSWLKTADVSLNEGPVDSDLPQVDTDAIDRAAKLLGEARNPLIVVGSGAQGASAEVRTVAEMLQAPVVSYRNGRGVLDARHYLSLTMPGGHRMWSKADVVLGIGTRLTSQQVPWGWDDDLKVVHIDLDPERMARLRPPTVGLVGDAAPTLQMLAQALGRTNQSRPSREEELTTLKGGLDKEFREKVAPQMAFLDAIRAELPEDGIFVDDLTQVGYVSRYAFPVHLPRTFLSSGYQGTLGWSLPAALGAKAAMPDRAVVAIAGDGGFMFNVQELATAVRHKLAVTQIVFNDGNYGNVRRTQVEDYDGRVIASDLSNPDFVKLAESFGIMGQRATTADELRAAVKKGIASEEPNLIEVQVGTLPSPWGFVALPKVRGVN